MLSDEAVAVYDNAKFDEIKSHYADNVEDISFWPVNEECERFLDLIFPGTDSAPTQGSRYQ